MVNYREKITKTVILSIISLVLTCFLTVQPMNSFRSHIQEASSYRRAMNFGKRQLFGQNYKRLNTVSAHCATDVLWQTSDSFVRNASMSTRNMMRWVGSSLLGLSAGLYAAELLQGATIYSEEGASKTATITKEDFQDAIIEVRELTYEERRAQAQEIKSTIDQLLLNCFGRNYWSSENKTIQFAQTADDCLKAIQGLEHLLDEFPEIFFLNQPQDWPRMSTKEIVKLLLEIRDESSTATIGNKLYYLFYLLPQELQDDWKKLGFRLYWRLSTGHPGTKPTYVYDEHIFNTKEQELR